MLKGTQTVIDGLFTTVAMVFILAGMLAIVKKSLRMFIPVIPEVNQHIEVSGNSSAINVNPYQQILSIRTPKLNTVDEDMA